MITSGLYSDWDLDTPITRLLQAGLDKPSVIRCKLYSVIINDTVQYLGKLSASDQQKFINNFQSLFKELYPYNIASALNQELSV